MKKLLITVLTLMSLLFIPIVAKAEDYSVSFELPFSTGVESINITFRVPTTILYSARVVGIPPGGASHSAGIDGIFSISNIGSKSGDITLQPGTYRFFASRDSAYLKVQYNATYEGSFSLDNDGYKTMKFEYATRIYYVASGSAEDPEWVGVHIATIGYSGNGGWNGSFIVPPGTYSFSTSTQGPANAYLFVLYSELKPLDQITLTLDNFPSNPYTGNPIKISWTNSVTESRKYRIYDSGNDITPGNNPVTQCSLQLNLAEGVHNLSVRGFDDYNCVSDPSNTKTFNVDATPPNSCSLTINNQTQYTNSRTVTLNIKAKDSGSGVTQLYLSENNANYTLCSTFDPTSTYGANIPYNITSQGDGVKYIYAKVKDSLGNTSGAFSGSIILDTTPPTGSISINNSATTTGSRNVTLNLTATDVLSSVASMQFSNDGANFSTAEPYNSTTNWILSDGEGDKTVFVKFTDSLGNTNIQPFSSNNIYYDNSPPFGTITINNGAIYTNSNQVTLNLTATDPGTVTGVRFANSEADLSNTAWKLISSAKSSISIDIPFNITDGDGSTITDGTKTVYVQYEDQYGSSDPVNHVSKTITANIILDTTPPDKPTISIAPAGPTNNRQPVVTFSSYDAVSGIDHYEIAVDNDTFYKSTSPYTLPALSAGDHTIKIKAYDKAGNCNKEAEIAAATITIDLTPPDAPVNFSHSKAADQKKVTFKWNSPSSDIAKFSGSVNLPDGTVKTVDQFNLNSDPNGGYKGGLELNISGQPSNQPVQLKVRAQDQAGNQSGESIYIVYTPAACGTLSNWNDDYDSTNGHYFTCTLNGGSAYNQTLEICHNQQFSSTDTKVIENNNGQFKVTGLDPHEDYYYRIVATCHPAIINGTIQPEDPNTDKTYSDLVLYKVPNRKPDGVDVTTMTPQGFTSIFKDKNENPCIKFNFNPVTDDDNDQLTYQVYWAEGIDPSSDSFILATGDQTDGFTLPNPIFGTSYTWFVRIIDSYKGDALSTNDSNKVHFTVDADPPQIVSLETPVQPYSNQRSLKIVIKDDLSGINKVTYKKTTDKDEIVVIINPLSDTIDTGCWIGEIPLTEGIYSLEIKIYDNAKNNTSRTINLQVDQTLPVLSNETVTLNTKENWYVTSGQIPVSWHATDDFSGVKGLYYWLVKGQPGDLTQLQLGKDNFIANNDLNNPNGLIKQDFNSVLQLSGITGDKFYLIMAAVDQAANLSDKYIADRIILLDKTPPVINDFIVTGFTQYGSGYYLTNPANLYLKSFNVTEDVTDITVKQYSIVDTTSGTEQTILGWTSNWQDVQKAGLTKGNKYRIKAQAINTAGLTAETSSPEFIFDNSAPGNPQISGPTGTMVGGETAIFNVSAEETYSPIAAYYLAIGTKDNQTELTTKVPGNQNGWIVLPANGSTGTIRIELPVVADGVYYPVLKVKNAAGIESMPVNGNQLIINNNQSKIVVHDQGPYTANNDKLTGWWEYRGPENVSGYQYRILGPNNKEIYPWHTTQATQVTVQETGLIFDSGSRYQFEVKAIFASGGESDSGLSPGIMVDTAPPVITKVTSADYSTAWNIQLTWSGHDDISGIARIQAAVGTSPYQDDISKGWLDIIGNPAKVSCDINGADLKLNNGTQYYLTLRLVNGAGLCSEQASSCIIIDNSPPPVPEVKDQGKYINTDPNQPMEAQWVFSPADPESGTCKYEWAIVESPAQIAQANWHDVGTQTLVTTWMDEAHQNDNNCYFPRIDAKTYYFAVRATNGAGLTSIGLSDGIVVDAKAPMVPQVRLIQGKNLDPSGASEVNYISNLNDLNLLIKSWAASGIDKVQYAWGMAEEVDGKALQSQDTTTSETAVTLNGLTYNDFVDVSYEGTNIKQVSKQIIFLGKCVSGAQNSAAGYSSGVMLETGAPIISRVNGYRSGDQYLFDWNINLSQSVSGLDHYEVALVAGKDLSGNPSGWMWQSVGLAQKYQIAVKDIPEGQYYLAVRGVNKANLASRRELNELGISSLIIVDYTPPEISRFIYSRYVDGQLKFHIEAGDQLTGIGGYQYALGTLADSKAFTNGWINISSQDGAIDYPADTANIPHNTPIYLTVQVKDGAGNWTIPGSASQLILVDHTPPTTPVVKCGAYTNNRQLISGISFVSDDPESGAVQYQIGVVNSPNELLDEETPLLPLANFDGRYVPGLVMTESGQYYIAVRTFNGAGQPSATGYSQITTVDSIAPELKFPKGDQEIVVNSLSDLDSPVNIEYWLSEDASVTFIQNGDDDSVKTQILTGKTGLNYYPFKENKPQTYVLMAIPTDMATNTGDIKVQKIRVNAPPEVLINEIKATPGQPLVFRASVYDPDGKPSDTFSYLWDSGDGGPLMTDANPTYKFTRLGSYILKVTVTDKDGGVTTVSTTVVVSNTSSGNLYRDETWSGIHYIYGDVTVPNGIILTILPGTQVIVYGNIAADGFYKLDIQGNLIIQGAGQPVTFSSSTGWKGIYLEGQATLDSVIIRNAERGMTVVNGASTTITNCTFQDNQVGLHAYGVKSMVSNCTFLNNTLYGIKEDEGGRPVVVDCRFSGNGMDYYSETDTDLTIDELNQITGNSGNK